MGHNSMIIKLQESPYSWIGQRSANPKIQAIINHGFWVDEVKGNLVYATIYGHSEVDYSGELPRIQMMRHTSKETTVIFNLENRKPWTK